MRLLFSYTGPIDTDNYKDYYARSVSNDVLSRYYDIADEVVMLTRVRKERTVELDNLSKLSNKNFNVLEVPNIFSAKGMLIDKFKTKKIAKEAVANADLVVSRIPCFIGNIVIDQAIKQNKPYLIELVGCPWDAMWNHSIQGKFVAPLFYIQTKRRVNKAEYTLYVTDEFLQKRYPTNGLETNCSNVMLQVPSKDMLNNRLKKIEALNLSKKIVVGTAAAVNVKYKGQQFIIEALGELKRKNNITNLEYQIVGDGDQTYLKDLVKKCNVEDQVLFLGTLPHNKIFEWLDSIDLYTQPSKQEGLPRALIEAMSRGIPAFGSNTAGIPELLENNFIFNKSKNTIIEIKEILTSFDKSIMKEQAIRNFNVAQSYSKDVINNRRKMFFKQFKKSIK